MRKHASKNVNDQPVSFIYRTSFFFSLLISAVWWRGFCVLGCRRVGLLCWAVVCFLFGLGNPRPSQECSIIFYQTLNIYDSVQMGIPLFYSYLVKSIPTFHKNIGYSKLTLMGVVEFCKLGTFVCNLPHCFHILNHHLIPFPMGWILVCRTLLYSPHRLVIF